MSGRSLVRRLRARLRAGYFQRRYFEQEKTEETEISLRPESARPAVDPYLLRQLHLHNKAAESGSRYNRASGCLRKRVAGHSVDIGPLRVAATAWALVLAGTTPLTLVALANTFKVRVMA